jgi:hypothetical protein
VLYIEIHNIHYIHMYIYRIHWIHMMALSGYNLKRFVEGSDSVFKKNNGAHIFLYEIHITFTLACEEEWNVVTVVTSMFFSRVNVLLTRINTLQFYKQI